MFRQEFSVKERKKKRERERERERERRKKAKPSVNTAEARSSRAARKVILSELCGR